MTESRPLHDPETDSAPGLEAILRPRSVAVVGASTQPGTIGAEVFRNLLARGFEGPVYPVNPKVRAVQSVRAYRSVTEIPDPVDLAVIVVPRAFVPGVVEECVQKGVKGVVVISAGFKETGGEGAAAEQRLKDLVRAHGIRLVGPNCLGVLNTDPGVRLDATFAPTFPPEGNVGIASQSGALGVVILDYARRFNVGVSEFVAMGNKTDVSGNDLLQWWSDDPRTQVVLLYLESFGNPRKFIRLARAFTQKKPIVAVKSGRSERGRKAASSHTGALAGTDAAVSALMAQTGVIRVDTVEELFDMAAFLAHQPVPEGRRVAILTNAGGPGILATDAAAAWGLEVPDLSPATAARLRELLPPEASVRNPVDMIASARAEEYERAVRILLEEPGVDAVIVIFIPPVAVDPRGIALAIAAGAAGATKPVLSCLFGHQGVPESATSGPRVQVPSYSFPETAVRVLARAAGYGEWLRRSPGTEWFPEPDALARVTEILKAHTAGAEKSDGWLPLTAVRNILKAYGIAFSPTRHITTPEEAARAARELGFPVVLKLVSESITHKSDVGGVVLDLRTESEVLQAAGAIREKLAARGRAGELEGFSVQPLAVEGVEVLVGVNRDPLFGPLLAFGLGGVHVEILKDVAFRLHPLTDEDARDMIREIQGYPLLTGYRGAPLADLEALESLLLRVAALAGHHPEILELDLNPVKVLPRGRGCLAVDARIRVGA